MTIHSGSSRGDFRTLYQGLSVDDLIIQYMEDNHIPGMSLAIVQAPYITRLVGYGFADIEKKRLVSTRTLFPIGQLTNAFTAVAIMQLKEEGKIKLDDLIANYLPHSPKNWNTVTIRQLITHASGIPDYTECRDFSYSRNYQPEDIFNLFQDHNLLFSSGSEMHTSSTNFYLLGLIIEKASDMSYDAYISKNQIERVGLKHTFFINNASSIKNEVNNGTNPLKHSEFLHKTLYIDPAELAVGYISNDKEAPYIEWSSAFANSGIIASAEDISIWDISLAGTILIKEAESSVSPVFEKPAGTSKSPAGTKTGDKYASGGPGRPGTP